MLPIMVASRRPSEPTAEFPAWPPRRSAPSIDTAVPANRFKELIELATHRGEAWAQFTYDRCPFDRVRPWPQRGAEIHRIAKSWCAPLTDDESSLLILAGTAVRSAAMHWDRLRGR